jgi:uncharacterized damage-inducible protein DinB
MSQPASSIAPFYAGWDRYQQLLVEAVAPLTAQQLTLRVAPAQRSVGEIAAHIVRTRAGWFLRMMGEEEPTAVRLLAWGSPDAPALAAELVEGLAITWRMIEKRLARWTPTDLEHVFQGEYRGQPYELSRQWVVWHVLEHDLNHGGELFLTLGAHGLPTPAL